MKLYAKAVSPENVEIEITARTTLGTWTRIAKRLRMERETRAELEFARAIDEAVEAMVQQWSCFKEIEK